MSNFIVSSGPEEEQTHLSSGVTEIITEKQKDPLCKNKPISSGDSFESTTGLTSSNRVDDSNDSDTSDRKKYVADSLKTLSEDLSALFGSDELSDFKVSMRSGEHFPCHKFILQTRCPAVLCNSELLPANDALDFSQYTVRATKVFFKYIYTGKIDIIYCLLREDINDLYVIAKKYNVEFLKKFILAEFKSDSLLLYSKETCSPPATPSRSSQISIQSASDDNCAFHEKSENSATLDKSELFHNTQPQEANMSCSGVLYPVEHKPSCSGILTSKIGSLDSPLSHLVDDNSSHDIFKGDINVPYKSSIISPNKKKKKRKLNHSNMFLNKLIKKYKSPLSNNTTEDNQQVIILDSDSDEECAIIKKTGTKHLTKRSINRIILGSVGQQRPMSKISNLDPPLSFLSDDNSSYNLFKSNIQSPCNSSVLLENLSLNYSKTGSNELKKNCSDPRSNDTERSNQEIIIDSDSDNKRPTQKLTIPPEIHIAEGNTSFTDDMLKDHGINLNISLSYNPVRVENSPTSDVKIDPSQSIPCLEQIRSSPLLSTSPSQIHKRSIDRYFEASFPDIDGSICNPKVPMKQSNQSTPSAPIVRNPSINITPLQEIIIHDATPKPDFSSMISPELKKQLKKYGLKPDLDPKKARILLYYIYQQIHPVVEDQTVYKLPAPSTSMQKSVPIVISDDESSNSDQMDGQNSENDFAYEEYMFNCSKEQNENSSCQNDGSSLREIVIKFIRSDAELFTNVVSFNPLLLKKFYKTFREHGVQCSMHDLMDVLDDLCVNYRVEQSEASLAKRNRRKPVKKKK